MEEGSYEEEAFLVKAGAYCEWGGCSSGGGDVKCGVIDGGDVICDGSASNDGKL